jgi:hypothetical protein
MSGPTPSPRNAAGEPQDARPIAPKVADVVEDRHAEGGRAEAVEVVLDPISETSVNVLLSCVFGFVITGWIVPFLYFAGHPRAAVIAAAATVLIAVTNFLATLSASDRMGRLEVSAARLQLSGSYHLVRECDRAEVRGVQLREGWVTITVRGRDEPFLKKRLDPRRVRRLRRALERYNWLEREDGSAVN